MFELWPENVLSHQL